MKYDLIIIGAGPSGIFTAIEMIKRGTNKKILIIWVELNSAKS